ncbi:MAG: TIR domain-containing protein [Terracidiphilus sp.]
MARYDVFFSYSRADTERVAPLREELRRRGYRVFFDVQSIDPGEQWKRRLERSIAASRALVLCWSQNTRSSEYITFEYSRAEAMHKPVLPWLLDSTPLPAMLEVQGITAADPAQVAAQLSTALGWPLPRRRKLLAALAALAAVLLGLALWIALRPPPPWKFQGEVTDRATRMPIPGVEVDVMDGNAVRQSVLTDAQGRYDLSLPQPKRNFIQLRFRKNGYGGDQLSVSSNALQPFPEDMDKIP